MNDPDEYPHEWHDVPPIPNCRCIVLFEDVPWQEDLAETLDEKIGDTTPLIDEFKSGLIIEYMV